VSLVFEDYVSKRNHITIERFFCDVLCSDARLTKYKPEKKKVLDLFNHEIENGASVGFTNCPIFSGIFVNKPYVMETQFQFTVPFDVNPVRWGNGKGEMWILGKHLGFLGLTGDVNRLGISGWLSDDENKVPGMTNLKTDTRLQQKLLDIIKKRLFNGDVIKIKYDPRTKLRPIPIGLAELQVRNSLKKWRTAIEDGLNPEEFIVDLFTSVISVVLHVNSYLRNPPPPRADARCCPKCGTETHTDFCPSCGHEISK